MVETLQKPPYNDLSYDEITKLINDAYADDPDMRTIAIKLGVSVSVVFEATGWKDYWVWRRDITRGE